MKLYFSQPNFPWQPERFKYSAEQMMLMLFPGEHPEYPDTAPSDQEENAACFTLFRGDSQADMTVQVWRGGKTAPPF